jgi:uncharacterized protein (TIRG00374 family)
VVLFIAVLAAVGLTAYTSRDDLGSALALMGRIAVWRMVPAAAAIGGVYLCRAAVYGLGLRALGFDLGLWFLWRTALVATSVHQLVPAAGGSGYAYLSYAFHQRGVGVGKASLVALIDALSYSFSVATLVVISLFYVGFAGERTAERLSVAFAPGLLVVALAAYVYYRQRDPDDFERRALRWKDRVARLLRRRWSDEPVRRFLGQYYEGKEIIGERRGRFAAMIGFQYGAVLCDVAALYAVFAALGRAPDLWVVFLGFVLAMASISVVGVPGGGGSFEVVMSTFFANRGIPFAAGIAATLLYRVVAFWLPAATSLPVLLSMRQRPTEGEAHRGEGG